MKNKFEEKESYLHYYAKEVLFNWLVTEELENDFCNVAQFNWRRNYGVFKELKFFETSDPYYFEMSGGLDYEKIKEKDYNNAFRDNYDRGKILFVPDITVFHKGTPRYLFEIVYTKKRILRLLIFACHVSTALSNVSTLRYFIEKLGCSGPVTL